MSSPVGFRLVPFMIPAFENRTVLNTCMHQNESIFSSKNETLFFEFSYFLFHIFRVSRLDLFFFFLFFFLISLQIRLSDTLFRFGSLLIFSSHSFRLIFYLFILLFYFFFLRQANLITRRKLRIYYSIRISRLREMIRWFGEIVWFSEKKAKETTSCLVDTTTKWANFLRISYHE